MSKILKLTINGNEIYVPDGNTVATAVLFSEAKSFRRSVSGEPRFPLCGMGICFECRVTIDGVRHQKSCQLIAVDGMRIETDE
jgi:sarcosine oxidase subunit alpha